MRIRSIKPEFFENDVIGEMPPEARLLFIGLWMMADKYGILEDNPKKIKALLFRYDSTSLDMIKKWLDDFTQNGMILRETSGKVNVICVPTFSKHQMLTTWEKTDSKPLLDENELQNIGLAHNIPKGRAVRRTADPKETPKDTPLDQSGSSAVEPADANRSTSDKIRSTTSGEEIVLIRREQDGSYSHDSLKTAAERFRMTHGDETEKHPIESVIATMRKYPKADLEECLDSFKHLYSGSTWVRGTALQTFSNFLSKSETGILKKNGAAPVEQKPTAIWRGDK